MAILDKAKRAIKKTKMAIGGIPTFDMSTKEKREQQAKTDYQLAKDEKAPRTAKMVELDNYYNNKPYTALQAQEMQEKMGLNFTPPVLTDPYIQVESQIDTDVPAFEFQGRDDDQDGRKAKMREDVVDYIMYNNHIDDLNIDNERTYKALGNAFWKVSFDGSIKGPNFVGDIVIGNPDPANAFPDPSAVEMDDCEFFDYPYRLHRRAARRTFGEIVDTIANDGNHDDTQIYENSIRSFHDETLQVLEHWYKDDEGDIACSIQIGHKEVKHIPKYWEKTRHSGNKMYPFIKYGNIPMRQSFWDKSEIEAIQDLCDAANREFITAILNDLFTANDIILVEKGALVDPSQNVNVSGAIVQVHQNKLNAIRRLGGIQQNGGILNMIQFIHEKIQETNGNFESAQGKEPVRVTTASGIAQLNERADNRKEIKKAGRKQGFRRLAELVDWTALEFYNTPRIVMIRGEKADDPRQPIEFSSDTVGVLDSQLTKQMEEPTFYYPKVDIEINVGEGLKKSKAFTLAATQELAGIQINPMNMGIVLSIVDILDLPNKQEVKDSITQAVQQQQATEQAQMQARQTPNPAAGAPTVPQGQQITPEDINAILQQLSPEDQQAFLQADPEHQIAMLQQVMGGAK